MRLISATATYLAKQLMLVMIGGDDSIDEAYIEMRCAGAVFTWELARSAANSSPGPVYDDATIAALLRGARG